MITQTGELAFGIIKSAKGRLIPLLVNPSKVSIDKLAYDRATNVLVAYSMTNDGWVCVDSGRPTEAFVIAVNDFQEPGDFKSLVKVEELGLSAGSEIVSNNIEVVIYEPKKIVGFEFLDLLPDENRYAYRVELENGLMFSLLISSSKTLSEMKATRFNDTTLKIGDAKFSPFSLHMGVATGKYEGDYAEALSKRLKYLEKIFSGQPIRQSIR